MILQPLQTQGEQKSKILLTFERLFGSFPEVGSEGWGQGSKLQ